MALPHRASRPRRDFPSWVLPFANMGGDPNMNISSMA